MELDLADEMDSSGSDSDPDPFETPLSPPHVHDIKAYLEDNDQNDQNNPDILPHPTRASRRAGNWPRLGDRPGARQCHSDDDDDDKTNIDATAATMATTASPATASTTATTAPTTTANATATTATAVSAANATATTTATPVHGETDDDDKNSERRRRGKEHDDDKRNRKDREMGNR